MAYLRSRARRLLEAPDTHETKGKRDDAIPSLLLGCGLRRAELIGLKLAHLQQRDDHWAIIDLSGKGGHVRTVPVPEWVKAAVDEWLTVACIEDGLIFRCVTHSGTVWGSGISEKVFWWVVTKSDSLLHKSLAAAVNGLVDFLGAERKRVPGEILRDAERLECLLF